MADHVLPKSLGRAGWPAEIDPVLVVEPGTGETIAFEVSDEAYAQMDEFRDLTKLTAVLNPVTGPVHIVGAEPGDTLAVHIHDIQLADTGWSIYLPGAGALAGPMGSEWFVRKIPVANGVAQLTDKISVPIAPMIGCIGVSSATTEMSSVMPSYPSGGNLDLTDARPGSTVYLPVEVEGARLGIGDLHAVMARGESSFVAIEIAGTAIVSVDLFKGEHLRAPRVDTGEEIVCVGLGDPVQEAIISAYEDLFRYLTEREGLSKQDAYAVMSATAHTELGGPTGSVAPDPLHPFRPVGAVTLARIAKDVFRKP